jgi:hypothetical protein
LVPTFVRERAAKGYERRNRDTRPATAVYAILCARKEPTKNPDAIQGGYDATLGHLPPLVAAALRSSFYASLMDYYTAGLTAGATKG